MGDRKSSRLEQPESFPLREYSIYVYDIARGVTDDNLKAAFSKIGDVQDALIVKNKFTGETKGYGFVRFRSMDDVYNTLDCTALPTFEDSVSHKTQTVKVTIADPKDTLYIGNIPRGWTEDDVIRILREVSVEMPHKFRFAERKTHGYVTYADHDTALNALKSIQRPPTGVQQSPFTAHLAPPKFYDSKSAPSMKVLFVRGTGSVSPTSREGLQVLFGGPEVVEKIVIPLDSSKRVPLGHAFVHYFSSKHAAAAMKKLNNTEYEGNKLTIEWSLPKSASKRELSFTKTEYPPPYSYPYAYSHLYPSPYPYYPEFYPPYVTVPPYDAYGGSFREYNHSGHSNRVDKRASASHHADHNSAPAYLAHPAHHYTGAPSGKAKAPPHSQKNRFLPY